MCDETLGRRYFDKDEARCKGCGDVTAQASAVFASLLFCFLAAVGGGTAVLQRTRCAKARDVLLKRLRKLRNLWTRAGMRYKVKTVIGLWQCLSAIPSVYNVTTPPGLERYHRWVNLIELPKDFGVDIAIPAACFGSYRSRLFIGASWPIILVASAAAAYVGWELVRDRLNYNPTVVAPRSKRAAVYAGVERTLPLTLVVTFLLVPSTGTRIFKTFLCDRFEYDETPTKSYLHDDLGLSCDSPEYDTTHRTALVTLIIWPVGVPVLYALLLWVSRDALLTGVSTPLSRATAFLSGDYSPTAFWWEPLEMVRKLTLTGAVLLIGAEFEQARVLVALLTSITFLTLHLAIKPLRRSEDGALMTLVELALILVYTCVLVIKSCEANSSVCATYGLGSTSTGVYLFFIFFGLSMLLVQLMIVTAKLYTVGYVPKILLVARAHSVSPRTILYNVMARKVHHVVRWGRHALRLDTARLSPRTAAAVLKFRTTHGGVPSAETPEELMAVATGNLAELHIENIFPRTTCFVQVDLEAFAIRWTHERFIDMHTIESVRLAGKKRMSGLFGSGRISLRDRIGLKRSSTGAVVLATRLSTGRRTSTSTPADGESSTRNGRWSAISCFPGVRRSRYAEATAPVPTDVGAPVPTDVGAKLAAALPAVVTTEKRTSTVNFSPGVIRQPSTDTDEPQTPTRTERYISCRHSVGDSGREASGRAGERLRMRGRPGTMKALLNTRRHGPGLHITYRDRGGVMRVLDLRMPGDKASKWYDSLMKLLGSVPRLASPPHWHWVRSCMAATSERGASGFLRHSELRSVLRHANASANLQLETLEATLRAVEESEQALALPKYLRTQHEGHFGIGQWAHSEVLLNARQVTGLLLRLCTASPQITALFDRFSTQGTMSLAGWLQFVSTEQLSSGQPEAGQAFSPSATASKLVERDDLEVARATQRFGHAVRPGIVDSTAGEQGDAEAEGGAAGLGLLQFALLLLDPANDAVAPAREASDEYDLNEPLSHYWIACTHNSYIIGDQLTGRSTADAYRRQLLQVSLALSCLRCRHACRRG